MYNLCIIGLALYKVLPALIEHLVKINLEAQLHSGEVLEQDFHSITGTGEMSVIICRLGLFPIEIKYLQIIFAIYNSFAQSYSHWPHMHSHDLILQHQSCISPLKKFTQVLQAAVDGTTQT